MAQLDWIGLYLREDLGEEGDITSDPIFTEDDLGAARLVARERCFLAGAARAAEVFERMGCTTIKHMNDGSWIESGAVVLEVSGPTRSILAAERVALNLIGRMSGIATMTRRVMDDLAQAESAAQVAATRKTTPGFRQFEKEAVAAAGGDFHRAGLYSAAMIKDNHREAAGDLSHAIQAIRAAHPDKELTTEVETLDDALLAAKEGTDWILIDNQESATGKAWAETVRSRHPGIKIEASGGITPDNAVAYGWADRIGMGAVTTQAGSIDFSLEWGPA